MTFNNEYDNLKWDEYYSLGNEKIDTQHRGLFDAVNKLIASCESGLDTAELNETLLFIVNYTVQHFDDEEALQIECNYPDYERHKGLHDEFKAVVINLVHRFSMTGSSDELCKDVKKIMIKWIVKHIMNEDKKIGNYLKGKNQPPAVKNVKGEAGRRDGAV